MTKKKDTSSFFDHDMFARSKHSKDFWGQIRRTVNGEPVSEDQIAMIVAAIQSGLNLDIDDVVLDLACGNGALSSKLFRFCSELHGVDFSEFLIDVALENFAYPPSYTFSHNDALIYLKEEIDPNKFTKASCYGSFSYLTEDAAQKVLSILYSKFTRVERFFIGNLPDYDRKELFYTRVTPPEEEYKSNQSSIGIWRSKDEFSQLAESAGWSIEFASMADDFYASNYRYDVILKR